MRLLGFLMRIVRAGQLRFAPLLSPRRGCETEAELRERSFPRTAQRRVGRLGGRRGEGRRRLLGGDRPAGVPLCSACEVAAKPGEREAPRRSERKECGSGTLEEEASLPCGPAVYLKALLNGTGKAVPTRRDPHLDAGI